MYERNWLGGMRGSPRYTREKVRLSTRREREEAAEMTNRVEGGKDEKRGFNIAATLLDATTLFTSKSKDSPFFSPAQANIDTPLDRAMFAFEKRNCVK